MWYNKELDGNWELNKVVEFVRETIDDVMPDEYVDEIIDESCDEVRIFDSCFSPSNILKKLDSVIWKSLRDELIDNIVEDCKYALDRYDPEENESLYSFLADRVYFSNANELKNVIWKA